MNDSPIRLLPVTVKRLIGIGHDSQPLFEWTAPGLVDIRIYPHLAPYTVPAQELPK